MKQLLLFLLVWMSLTESMSARPNLVLIFIDDMGYGDIGPFGSQLNRTPHLDRMAKEGRKLTSFLCRAGLLRIAGATVDRLLRAARGRAGRVFPRRTRMA